jgi:site-specific DNA-methyltransferase (adenine-specific)
MLEHIDWASLEHPQLFINGDCMEYMKTMPDKYVDLAICDPPYGILNKTKRGGQRSPHKYKVRSEIWDYTPDNAYWNELFRVSQNQIVCGGNYFTNYLFPNNAWIFWYKHQPVDNYADGEFIWTSFTDKQGKIFDYMYYGSINSEQGRFHPTQKPVKLYGWLLANYAKPGDKILDTHVGSASSLIACHNYGFEYIGFEIDKDYYDMATERIRIHMQQQTIFDVRR